MIKSRQKVLEQAVRECIVEMYRWSQPSIDINDLLKSDFKDDEQFPLWKKHFLSSENYIYLKDVFADTYGIVDDWNDIFETIYTQLKEGGSELVYKEGTTSYQKVDPLQEHLANPEDIQTVLEYLNKIQYFFKGHSREINSFNSALCFGPTPSSNKEAVEKYWQENGHPEFKIKDFNIEDIIYSEDLTEEEFINNLK